VDAAPRLLILETSGRAGQVALAVGDEVRGARVLDETRRHARDLAPTVADLLQGQGWRARDLDGVIVGRGPGSYTGLRVGLMSARTLAYATGCALLAVDTFAALAFQVPTEVERVDVLADAQQDRVYFQPFVRVEGGWRPPAGPAVIRVADWLAQRESSAAVTGPGLVKWQGQLPPEIPRVPAEAWHPRPESLLRLGLARFRAGERDDLWTVEPLYLRASSAEEQWDRRG
jgi:tRNA threonylcarbamoyladenosine biosynthesis protein TsaB